MMEVLELIPHQPNNRPGDTSDNATEFRCLTNRLKFHRATTNATDYPIGSRCWDVHSPPFNGMVTLNLNACDDEEEYNCADGTCVVIEDRCNGKNDCPDGSDEQARNIPITRWQNRRAALDECHFLFIFHPPSTTVVKQTAEAHSRATKK